MLKEIIEIETNEYAKKFYETLFIEGYNLVGEERYANASGYVGVKCSQGHVYKATPSNFNRGSRCNKCEKNERKKRAAKVFYNALKKDKYTLASENGYVNAKTKVKVKCNQGHVYDVNPDSFVRGYRCAKCYGCARFTTEYFKEYVYQETGEDYTVIGEYVNNSTKIRMRHNNESCGNYEWDVLPSVFRNNGSRCPKCANYLKHNTEQFKKSVYELVKGEYTVIGEYINSDTPILLKHNSQMCDFHEWKIVPYNFKSGKRCPKCSKLISIGERLIERYLKENHYNYIWQYKTKECKNQKVLSFDFAIMNNTQVVRLIEYQGKQHYEPVEFFGGIKKFKQQQQNDEIKNEYCSSNGIPLIEIPYWETDNIKEILDKELKNLIKTSEIKTI